MTSILESKYLEPTRPYSQKELQNKLNIMFRNVRVGKVWAHHKRCGHMYLTRMNGRKEKDILELKNKDAGSCSVCWKLHKTPEHLQRLAHNMVSAFQSITSVDLNKIAYNDLDLITVFYTWLYIEFN